MEGANHVDITMAEDIGANGTPRSKFIADSDQSKQACGSVVSFHHIDYNVQLKSGFLCKRKTPLKAILVDLKSVASQMCQMLILLCLCQSASVYSLSISLVVTQSRHVETLEETISSHSNSNVALFLDSAVQKAFYSAVNGVFFSEGCLPRCCVTFAENVLSEI